MVYRLKTTDLRCEEGKLLNWFSTAFLSNEVSLVEISGTCFEIVKLVIIYPVLGNVPDQAGQGTEIPYLVEVAPAYYRGVERDDR